MDRHPTFYVTHLVYFKGFHPCYYLAARPHLASSAHLYEHMHTYTPYDVKITESPKTPGHYRYLWVLVYIPYTGLAVFSFAISRGPVYTAISNFSKFVFSTLQSRSCWQLTNLCVLRGLKG